MRHYKRQEYHDDGEVDQGEPLDLRVVYVQILVPSGQPCRLTLDEIDTVTKGHLGVFTLVQFHLHTVFQITFKFFTFSLDRVRVDSGTNNSVLVRTTFMVLDKDLVVIGQVQRRIFNDSEREPSSVELGVGLQVGRVTCNGQPIDDPIVLESGPDVPVHKDTVGLGVNALTELFTCLVLQHVDGERRVEDTITKDDRSETLTLLLSTSFRGTEMESWEVVVVGVNIGLGIGISMAQRWSDMVHQHGDTVELAIRCRGHTR